MNLSEVHLILKCNLHVFWGMATIKTRPWGWHKPLFPVTGLEVVAICCMCLLYEDTGLIYSHFIGKRNGASRIEHSRVDTHSMMNIWKCSVTHHVIFSINKLFLYLLFLVTSSAPVNKHVSKMATHQLRFSRDSNNWDQECLYNENQSCIHSEDSN